ncbi:MAG: hypothetical protein AAF705_06390 [Bacteroidota bacterium]
MSTTSQRDGSNISLPRILTKKALRIYFKVSPNRFRRYYYTQDLKERLGIHTVEEDRKTKTFNIEQTKIIIDYFKFTPEELYTIAKYQ